MTEADWNSCTDPQAMLEWLRHQRQESDRKLRLFAVACCRRIWHLLTDPRSRRAVEVTERYADGEANEDDLHLAVSGAENVAGAAATSSATVEQEAEASAAFAALNATVAAEKAAAYSSANACSAVYHAATAAQDPSPANARNTERGGQSRLLRDLFANPFRSRPRLYPSVLAWNDNLVVRMANAVYKERQLPAGTLDPARLAILADALEDAGCEDAELLGHLRSEGPHCRGCWPVDLLLGRW
jgi:hypothetical protein